MKNAMSTASIALLSALVAMASAAAAWGAVFMQRKNTTDSIRAQINIAARNSRAAVVSANRQKWIDALRDDIAEFVATRAQIEGLSRGSSFNLYSQEGIALRTRVFMLRSRIELRINRNEPEHQALLDALDRYGREASDEADIELRKQASAIFKAEWERLKKEASGIDPFVRENLPRA